jgi:asparagine synthase (glutamine-hydrolysing)
MCGIAGFISKTRQDEKIDNFVRDISHRGPDNQSYIINSVGQAFLHMGSTRLAIRGDSNEDMPMVSKNGDVIIYNGEIFDIKTIKTYLNNERIYKGDTRLLFDLLRENVSDISKVNGMYAFAYFDNIKKKLFLGRDKLGIKPLFYSITKDGDIYFSSEMKSLINALPNTLNIREKSIDSLFLFNGIAKDVEFIDGVKSVKPGELLSIDLLSQNKLESKSYKNYQELDDSIGKNNFEELMTDVVKDHLNADTGVDLFLSGGIDSSLLAYIIKSKLKTSVRHFSLTFENKGFDESNNISKLSESLSLESKIFSFNEREIDTYVNEALTNMNSPILDYSFVPTYLLAKETSKFTKAVLSGDGADELFGGYEWYRGILFYSLIPYKLKIIISKIINNLNFVNKKNSYLPFSEKVYLFFKFISKQPHVQMIIWQSSYQNFDSKKIEYLASQLSKYIDSETSIQNNLRKIDLNNFLYSNVLPKVDVASMANSLEVRPPYLDDRIISFAFNNKYSNRISASYTKTFLRDYLDNTEIKFINRSKKQGFGFPLSKWLNDYGIDRIRQLFIDGNLVYSANQESHIKEIIFKDNLNINDIRELWAYYVISIWCADNKVNLI